MSFASALYPYKERLRELDLFILRKIIRGGSVIVFNLLLIASFQKFACGKSGWVACRHLQPMPLCLIVKCIVCSKQSKTVIVIDIE